MMRRPGWRSEYSDLPQAGLSGVRIPLEARFSAPLQTCPGYLPAFFTVGTVSLPLGPGVDHPPPCSTKV